MSKKLFGNFFKGMGVGASMLLPGVSGGTMAILLGIYDDLISAISSFLQNTKKKALLLSTFGLGSVLGMLLFSKPVHFVTTTFEMPMFYLFIGAILGGLPVLYKKANVQNVSTKKKIYYFSYALIGCLIAWLISLIPKEKFVFDPDNGLISYGYLIIAGVICAVAMVLPGISLSHMLLVMGMYEPTILALQQLDLIYLFPILIGGVVGTIATARILERAMEKHSQATYFMIIGFLIASLSDVVPKAFPQGIEWVICPLTLLGGFFAIFGLSKAAKKY
jgi:putative membrane protein